MSFVGTSLRAAMAGGLLLTTVSTALGDDYQLIDLGPWSPTAINSASCVVGRAGGHAAMWKDGVLTDLNDRLPPGSDWVLESATDINHFGIVVGSGVRNGSSRGFYWDGVGDQFVDIGDLGGGETWAEGINDNENIVGWSRNAAGHGRAVLYDGTLHDLGTLGGDVSFAIDISNYDTIVGVSDLGPEPTDQVAFYMFSGLPMVSVGTLGGDDSAAYGIGDLDHAVGWSEVFPWSDETHACYWSFMSITDLGTLPGYEQSSVAFAINGEDYAVGYSENASGERRAFLWRGSGDLVDLNTLIDPQSGWVLQFPTDINNFGEIVGTGTLNGEPRAYLLRPYRPEACCMPDGSCNEQDPRDCLQAGGQPEGWQTDCVPNPCPQPQGCCRLDGSCEVIQVLACWQSGGVPSGDGTSCNPDPCPDPKLWQPPATTPISPPLFDGWDELSRYGHTQIVADDWQCLDDRPITEIHWWGSYRGTESPPGVLPSAFEIGIWTNVPAGGGNPWSHPGSLLWRKTVSRIDLLIRAVGTDGTSATSQERCYQFEYVIPETDWFVQSPATHSTYWLSIAARYGYCPCDGDFNGDGQVTMTDSPGFMACFGQPPEGACAQADMNCDGTINTLDQAILSCQINHGWADPACCTGGTPVEPDYPWGWTTRRPMQGGAAIRITSPLEPIVGSSFIAGQTVQDVAGAADVAFVLLSSVAAQPQACCLPDGTCTEVPAITCMMTLSGTPKGQGTTCALIVPSITDQPENASACVGGSLSFTVAATGAPPLAFQWEQDGQPISGANAPTLELENVDPLDAGIYAVRVSNSCGAVLSQPAFLAVWPTAIPDVNGDGPANALDIQPFVDVLLGHDTDPRRRCACDMDGDGGLETDDISLFVTALLSAP